MAGYYEVENYRGLTQWVSYDMRCAVLLIM